jgi:hypothetical protein
MQHQRLQYASFLQCFHAQDNPGTAWTIYWDESADGQAGRGNTDGKNAEFDFMETGQQIHIQWMK